MPLYEHENFGDVQEYIFMKGIVTAVNSADDTANITVEGGSDGSAIPLFYHCKPDSEERENGAIDGASAAFVKNDEVIVMCTVDGEPVRIVGFVDGIQDCGIVELISAASSFSNSYSVGPDEIVGGDGLREYEHSYEVFNKYFSFLPNRPNADITEESCVCVVPGAPQNTVVNVAADNLYSTAKNHKDDWHYVNFLWVGFPYWFAGPYALTSYLIDPWGPEILKHPGLNAGASARYYHLSHSQFTYGYMSHQLVQRHIDQEKRLYRPGLINLEEDDTDPEDPTYLMTEAGLLEHGYRMAPYGKKPFTRSPSTEKVLSYNERVSPGGGGGSYSINGPVEDVSYNMLMFFWPFIPYMWEIPYFNFFQFYKDHTMYGRCITPESGSALFRGWDIKSNIGEASLSADSATLTGTENVHTETSDQRPYIEYVGLHITFVGSENATWVDTATNSWGYTAEAEKTVPIGTVCNDMALSVMNSISLTASYRDSARGSHTKSTNLGLNAYLWPPAYLGWWAPGTYVDNSVSVHNLTEIMDINATLQSEIKFGDTIIESGTGSMSYDYDWSEGYDVNNTFTIIVEDGGGPYGLNAHSSSGFGTRTDTVLGTGLMNREIVSFAVLDYDSESIFDYGNSKVHAVAVVYKKITISHTISCTLTRDNTAETGGAPLTSITSIGGFNNVPRQEESPSSSSNVEVRSGTRTVEYKVYANVGGQEYTKTLSTVTVTMDGTDQSVTGDRIYGVVCKLQNNSLLLTYDLDEFVTTARAHLQGGAYDSPFNFEDWNSCQDTDMWETKKRVIGVVYLGSDGFGTELYDEHDPISDEIYAVSFKT